MAADLVVRCRAEIDRLRKVADSPVIEAARHEAAEDRRIAALMVQPKNRRTLERRAEVTDALVAEFIAVGHSFVPAALDAFTAILDEHHPTTCEAECAIPCRIIAAVAAALGVGDQETQP